MKDKIIEFNNGKKGALLEYDSILDRYIVLVEAWEMRYMKRGEFKILEPTATDNNKALAENHGKK